MTDIPDQKLKFRSRFPEADQGSAELNKPLAERFKGKPRAHARAIGEKTPQHVARGLRGDHDRCVLKDKSGVFFIVCREVHGQAFPEDLKRITENGIKHVGGQKQKQKRETSDSTKVSRALNGLGLLFTDHDEFRDKNAVHHALSQKPRHNLRHRLPPRM